MSKVTVYQFTIYNSTTDETFKSRRWATREAIEKAINAQGGEVLENTATEVDASLVGSEVAGMTERDFNPH